MLGGYPVITSNLVLGNGIFGTADPFNANLQNNGAQNPLGELFYLQPGEGGVQSTGNGRGSGLWVKYVLYKSTDVTAVKAGPALVYWTDETYTQVTDIQSESLLANANGIAGWLMPNTTALGSTAFTIAILRNGGLGSYVFIGLQGFIAGAFSVALTAAGDALIGSATAWTPARVAAGTAPTNVVGAWALTAISGGLSDVEAVLPLF